MNLVKRVSNGRVADDNFNGCRTRRYERWLTGFQQLYLVGLFTNSEPRRNLQWRGKISSCLSKVRGFVWGNEEKLLISDYVSNGSLHCSSIYAKSGSSSTSSQIPLSFKARLKIARGIARGIAYIHDKKHVHGNIKPNNILFDSDFEPMIADTGLDRLMTPAHSHIACSTSSSQHHPPEWSTSEKPNPKWDVYSFGVVFLELLIGRVFLVDRDLVRDSEVDEKTWFLRLVDGTISSDVAQNEDEVVACFRLSYSCVSSLPQKRPSMKEVVQVLEKISV